MNKLLHSLILFSALTVVGCSSQSAKQEVIYTSSSENEWKILKLKECKEQSIIITLASFESRQSIGDVITEEQVMELQKWLMDRCARFYKLVI